MAKYEKKKKDIPKMVGLCIGCGKQKPIELTGNPKLICNDCRRRMKI